VGEKTKILFPSSISVEKQKKISFFGAKLKVPFPSRGGRRKKAAK
jgi:cysteine synthase